jgi:hypothetical protein
MLGVLGGSGVCDIAGLKNAAKRSLHPTRQGAAGSRPDTWHPQTPQHALRIARSWRLRVASAEDSLQGTGRLRGASLRLVRSCG